MTIRLALRRSLVAILLIAGFASQGTWALASTTGGISGTVIDTATGRAVADATVTASSPSQAATGVTDSGGHFIFLTLSPDTYTVSATKTGYNSASQSGITVFADQTHTLTLGLTPSLKTIANVTARAAGNLVKPGTTSDIYSVNAATQQVVSGSGGGFNLNQAYSGIYSQPGVTSFIGNSGWGQVFYIRGSSYNQIGYEFDGVPVNRAFDNYQANSLASLGQQELQVYTGGSPSGASSATLGGFINQVIKTGTYPGYGLLKGGIGGPGFYHALTGEAGGSNPNRTFSYYIGIQGYNQHLPAGSWNQLNNINSNGLNQYGLTGIAEAANWLGAMDCDINGGCADSGRAQETYLNGPFGPCQNSGPNAGLPVGYTVANPGTFNGACFGYYPFQSLLSDIYERDNVVNLHFAIPHHNDSGRDDIQLLYDNSMQLQMNGDAASDIGGLAGINALLTPYGTLSSGNSPYPGICGYENLWGAFFGKIGCAQGPNPVPYMDSLIWAPGTSFGQPASTAVAVPYYFPSSPTNRAVNAPCSLGNALSNPTTAALNNCQANGSKQSGLPGPKKDGFWNDVGIVKAQYTKNIGSNAYARLFGYTFYSDWLQNGPVSAATSYLDGLLAGYGGFTSADYELTTHTRGAEFQFADQINPQNLLRFTANYTTASVARWNNGSWEAGYAGSRSGVTDWTNGDPNNPICYNRTTGQPWNCDSSSAYGTYPFPATSGLQGPTPTNLAVVCAPGGTLAGTPGCVSFNAGQSNWLVTTPSGQGTYNTVQPVFTSYALEDEFKPNDRLDLNLGVRFESYQYKLANLNTPEFNFWFNAYAQVLCYDPGTGLPQIIPLTPGQPAPPALKVTNTPFASCGTAPSGQTGLHPTGSIPGCVTCGPLRYSAQTPGAFTRTMTSPRIGGTYTMSPDDVIRFSAGKYTQPTETAFEQYSDQSGKRAANFDFSRFWQLGFNTPNHDNPVQYSNNYDFSWEHRFHNSDVTFKISPFYRDTHNQIETVVLGPAFVSGTNTGHQHSWGLELQVQKGDPTRDGWSGAVSYTYTKALVQYGNLPSGTNGIDYINTYVTAFNALTSAGGGSQCYYQGAPDPTCTTPAGGNAGFVIKNPYYSLSPQAMLDRTGWYQTYPNEAPNAPNDQGSAPNTSAIWPHQISAWVQYKHGRWAIAPNLTIVSGAYYGSPTDTYGIDPRVCGNNEGAATTGNGTPIVVPAGDAQNCDFITAGNTFTTDSGLLAIPNPFTGKFDAMGQFQEPWQANLGALVRYDISPRVTANLTLTNIWNYCWGGTTTAWSTAFKPGTYVCGYAANNGSYLGPVAGQPGFGSGFFYGDTPGSASNGSPTYPGAFNYPFAPFTAALPFQAYLELQIKL